MENNSTLIRFNPDRGGITKHSKQILGLVGSPRKLGNCEVFIKEISGKIGVAHELNLIRLPSLNILPCRACYGCIMGNPCPNKDDMEFLLESIVKSDAIIVATPVYYFGAHSIFKRILDRGFIFYDYIEKTYNKPCILINIYGIEDRIGVSPQTLMTLASSLCLNIKESINIRAALPGEILMNADSRQKTEELAETLFSDKEVRNKSGCPYCGCNIVRIEKERFICTLCHSHFSMDNQGNRIKIKDGGIFGHPEYMHKHREWLKGMKSRFLQKRKEILENSLPYKNMGKWIEPDKTVGSKE
jgi:multimeric flavodoxin WrbA